MNLLRNSRRDRVQFDFLVHSTQSYDYEQEAKALGARVIRCLSPQRPWIYAANFRGILKEYGPYAAVHSHVHHFSALPILLAQLHGIPIRITHLHTTNDARLGTPTRCFYRRVMERLTWSCSTHLYGASREACEMFWGARCWRDPRVRVIRNGIDLNRFLLEKRRETFPHLRVVHVGRLEAAKNHDFLLRVQGALRHSQPDAELLLVGEGSLRPRLERSALAGVSFYGLRSDVPDILASCDVMAFPSLYEGFGLAVLEAQAAGVPCVVSDQVPREVDLGLGILRFLPLDSVEDWARAILAAQAMERPAAAIRRQALLAHGFDIREVARGLEDVYSAV